MRLTWTTELIVAHNNGTQLQGDFESSLPTFQRYKSLAHTMAGFLHASTCLKLQNSKRCANFEILQFMSSSVFTPHTFWVSSTVNFLSFSFHTLRPKPIPKDQKKKNPGQGLQPRIIATNSTNGAGLQLKWIEAKNQCQHCNYFRHIL